MILKLNMRDNLSKNAIYLCAGIYSVLFIALALVGRGVWVIQPAVQALWLGWLGLAIGHKLPRALKVVAGIVAFVSISVWGCLVLYSRVQPVEFLNGFSDAIGSNNSHYFFSAAALMAGIAVSAVRHEEKRKGEWVLFLAAFVLSALLTFALQRVRSACGWPATERVLPLLTGTFIAILVANVIPLLPMVYHSPSLILAEGRQRIACKNWFRVTVWLLSIVSFVLLLLEPVHVWRNAGVYSVTADACTILSQPLVAMVIMTLIRAFGKLNNKDKQQC